MPNRVLLKCLTTILVGLISFTAFATDQTSQTLITNVQIWDGSSEALSSANNLLIEDNLIVEVSDQPITTREGANVIDGKGGVLVPGLIDMHTHLTLKYGVPPARDKFDSQSVGAMAMETMQSYLDRGYTTLRDIGGGTLGLARIVKEGLIHAPRLYSSGAVISGISGHGDWSARNADPGEFGKTHERGDTFIVTGRNEVMEAVRNNLKGGASQIKVMVNGGMASEYDPLASIGLTLDELKAAVEAAADYGTYVCGHAYDDAAVNRAIDAGLKCIEHGFLMEEKTMRRMVKEDVWLSLQSWAATVAIADADSITFFTEDQKNKARAVYVGAINMMEWAAKYDVKIYAGTDMYFHAYAPNVTDDLIARLPWFSPVEILKHNTSNAGQALSETTLMNPYKQGKLGVIEKGAYADLLIIDGNPLEDLHVLKDLDKLKLIMKDGKAHKNSL